MVSAERFQTSLRVSDGNHGDAVAGRDPPRRRRSLSRSETLRRPARTRANDEHAANRPSALRSFVCPLDVGSRRTRAAISDQRDDAEPGISSRRDEGITSQSAYEAFNSRQQLRKLLTAPELCLGTAMRVELQSAGCEGWKRLRILSDSVRFARRPRVFGRQTLVARGKLTSRGKSTGSIGSMRVVPTSPGA
jgi:hypothetical protein